MDDNPFKNLGSTDTADAPDAIPSQADPADGMTTEVSDEDVLSYLLDMEFTEDDFKQPVIRKYQMPAENSYVPLQITSVDLITRELTIIFKNPKTGENETRENFPIPHFEMQLQHVANCYGNRSHDYKLWVPIPDMLLARKNPKAGQDPFWKKDAGRKLLAAARLLKPGMRMNTNLEELKEELVGKVILCRIRYNVRKYPDTEIIKDAFGQAVSVRQTPKEELVELQQLDAGDGDIRYVFNDGQEFTESSDLIYPYEDSGKTKYFILDPSDDGKILKKVTSTTRTYDNLDDLLVSPIPHVTMEADKVTDEIKERFEVYQMPSDNVAVERLAHVTRTDGSTIYAEITWDTVGQAVVKPIRAGTTVQVVTAQGEILTVNWIGNTWVETPIPHRLEVTNEGKLVFLADPNEADLENALDVFK